MEGEGPSCWVFVVEAEEIDLASNVLPLVDGLVEEEERREGFLEDAKEGSLATADVALEGEAEGLCGFHRVY